MKNCAKELFTAPGHPYNCAQVIAIAAADGNLAAAEAWRPFGGGRAPEGLCGALYAAMQSAPEDKRQEIFDEFERQAGATTCRAIKNATTPTPCAQCVAIAETLLAQSL